MLRTAIQSDIRYAPQQAYGISYYNANTDKGFFKLYHKHPPNEEIRAAIKSKNLSCEDLEKHLTDLHQCTELFLITMARELQHNKTLPLGVCTYEIAKDKETIDLIRAAITACLPNPQKRDVAERETQTD
jgi:hypothetical protein